MARYLVSANYSSDGIKGLLADGGTARETAVKALFASVGATTETVYFSLGNKDVVLICDGLDQEGLNAVGMTIASTGAITSYEAIPLSTAAEVDAAAKRSPAYQAPGA